MFREISVIWEVLVKEFHVRNIDLIPILNKEWRERVGGGFKELG